MGKVIVASNRWFANYEENEDGTVCATITDSNGKQYSYRQTFSSLDELV